MEILLTYKYHKLYKVLSLYDMIQNHVNFGFSLPIFTDIPVTWRDASPRGGGTLCGDSHFTFVNTVWPMGQTVPPPHPC